MQTKTKRKPKGIGDTIASITSAIGIEPCEGCDKRKDALNNLMPFTRNQLTENDIEFIHNVNLELESDKNNIWRLYTKIFEITGGKPNNCQECWTKVINDLKHEIKQITEKQN